MKEEINRQVFDHLVSLAALKLTPQEAEYLRDQMNQQLQVIHEMEQIPIEEDLEISSHGVALTPSNSAGLREDEIDPHKSRLSLEKIAPDVKNNFIIVPEIPHHKI
ncbi:MAG TPA: hypothetical protein VN226_00170 [Anaerolineales bacterium]|nr:hypothetical protein [Anaerolineales bacterium]